MTTPPNAAHVADLLQKTAMQIFNGMDIGGLMILGAQIIRDQLTELDSTRAQCATDTRIANEVESLLNDLDIGSVADLRKHITDLTAKVKAARNPPYRIVINKDDLGSRHGEQFYQSIVIRGSDEVMLFDWHDTEDAARAEAQEFIDKLTAPFQPKES